MKKKFLVLVLATTISLSAMATAMASTSVSTGGDVVPGEVLIDEKEFAQNLLSDSNLSAKERNQVLEKLNVGSSVTSNKSSNSSKTKASGAYSSINLVMKQFKQEKEYYCGPATVYQTLYYINGSSPSQSKIATAIGTTTDGSVGANMIEYINEKQSTNEYMIHNTTTLSKFKAKVNYSLSHDCPAILRAKLSKSSSFGYKSSGHYLNIGGQDSGASEYYVVDPYYGYSSGPKYAKYYVDAEEAFDAVNNHFAQEMYY